MNRRHIILTGLSLLLAGTTMPARAQDPAEAGMALLKKESLEGLSVDMSAADLTALLGKPEKTGKDVEWAAIGEYVQEWAWPKQGITASMASEKKGGKKRVLLFTAVAPCQRATKAGIRIGSTEADVRKAYGKYEDKETGKAGKSFIAGSVYGGLQFDFQKGKVSSIFFGASAE